MNSAVAIKIETVRYSELDKIQKCVCCLTDSGPFVNLTNCIHTHFLETHFKFYDFVSSLVCYTCHIQLKNISDFKQLVDRSYSVLSEQNANSVQNGSKRLAQSKFVIVSIERKNTPDIPVVTHNNATSKLTPEQFEQTPCNVAIKVERACNTKSSTGADASLPKKRKLNKDNELSTTESFPVKSKMKIQETNTDDNNSNRTIKQKSTEPKKATKKKVKTTKRHKREMQRCDFTVFICYHCDQHFVTKVLLIDHMKSHFPDNTNKSFKCKYCKLEADSRESIDIHLMLHGFKRQNFICNICGYRFKNQQVLNDHVFKCSTKSKEERILDYKKANTAPVDKSYICTVCKFKCSLSSDLANHIKIHTTNNTETNCIETYKTFICHHCNLHFTSKEGLTDHMKMHFPESNVTASYNCRYCKFETYSRDLINQHLVSHGFKKQNFICNICGYRFKSQKIFDNHAAKCFAKSRDNEKKLKYKN